VIEETLLEAIDKMDKAVDRVQSQFSTVRTGRAAPALIEKLNVDYYGSHVPLQQLCSIQVPEARQLLVRPHDRNSLGSIEKAIRDSDLGVNPSNDGTTIRLSFPPLTEERRKEYVKVVKNKGEEHKIAIRNERRDAKEMIEELTEGGDLAEDEGKKALEKVQAEVDLGIKKVDEIIANKEKDLMQV
jgi:ribosome recycling factor